MIKYKVVFCTDGIFPMAVGGMQRHSRLLIEGLAKQGNTEIVVIHPHKNQRIFPEFPNITEIGLDPLPGKRYYLLELYQYSRRAFDYVSRYPDHLIYSQGLSIWYRAAELGRRLIINPHGLEPYQTLTFQDYLKTLPFRWAFNRLFNRAAVVLSLGGRLSDILHKQIARSSTSTVVVIPNATQVPPESVQDLLKTSFTQPIQCLFVGRFAANKGVDVLMEAIDRLNQQGLGEAFHFTLAGKGPLFEHFSRRPAVKNVEFLGFVDDDQLAGLYRSSHVFILPTLFEGMPTVVLEAMACGMAILVTDVGATLELVDQQNGFILEKRNSQSIVLALEEFLALTDAEKTVLSRNSINKMLTRFTWNAVVEQHETLFERLSNQYLYGEVVNS